MKMRYAAFFIKKAFKSSFLSEMIEYFSKIWYAFRSVMDAGGKEMFENMIQITNEMLKRVPLDECDQVRVYGRTNGDRNPLVLYWTASGIEMRVKASEVWVEVESTYNLYEPWVSVTMNDAFISRQMLPKGRYYIPLIRNMNGDQEKTIRLYKDVQAMSADDVHGLKLYSILLDGEFVKLPEKSCKLEFIGDSITSGEGVIGAKEEQDWISMFFDSVHDYATLTAQALNADYHIISQSGWGVLTSWDNNPGCALPDYYDKLCGLSFGEVNHRQGADAPYDFSKWSADVIVVNLGTNDGGAFNSPEYIDPVTGKRTKQRLNPDGSMNQEDLGRFKEKCKQFLGVLRFHNPKSKILWAYGMLGTPMEASILQAIEEFKNEQGDEAVYYVRLPENTEETVGSRCHPGVKNHQQAAETLTEKIRELL
jgi:hypothetical protein